MTGARARRSAHRWRPGGGREHDGALFARVRGSGPPIVLLHGLTGSNRYWGAAYDRLATDHTLIVPDLLGFGRSPKPDTGYGLDDHIDAIDALLAELNLGSPIHLGAHSIGTVIALRYAHRHPGDVRRVVGFGPPLFPAAAAARAHLGAMGPMARLFTLPGPVTERACRWVCDHRALSARVARWTHPSLPRVVAEDSVQHTWPSYSQTLTDVLLTEHGPWLDQVGTPIHLVAGTHDRVVDLDHLRTLARRSNIELELWPGDHHLPLREAEHFAALIEDRIRRPDATEA